MENVVWGWHDTRMLGGREGFDTLAAKIDTEMLNHLDVLFAPRVNFRFQWVHAEVDVTAVDLILVVQPVVKLWTGNSYRCADAFDNLSSPWVSRDDSQAVGEVEASVEVVSRAQFPESLFPIHSFSAWRTNTVEQSKRSRVGS